MTSLASVPPLSASLLHAIHRLASCYYDLLLAHQLNQRIMWRKVGMLLILSARLGASPELRQFLRHPSSKPKEARISPTQIAFSYLSTPVAIVYKIFYEYAWLLPDFLPIWRYQRKKQVIKIAIDQQRRVPLEEVIPYMNHISDYGERDALYRNYTHQLYALNQYLYPMFNHLWRYAHSLRFESPLAMFLSQYHLSEYQIVTDVLHVLHDTDVAYAQLLTTAFQRSPHPTDFWQWEGPTHHIAVTEILERFRTLQHIMGRSDITIQICIHPPSHRIRAHFIPDEHGTFKHYTIHTNYPASLYTLRHLFHEFGHALHYLHRPPPQDILQQIMPNFVITETAAILWELLLHSATFWQEFFGGSPLVAESYAQYHRSWSLYQLRVICVGVLYQLYFYHTSQFGRQEYREAPKILAQLYRKYLACNILPYDFLNRSADKIFNDLSYFYAWQNAVIALDWLQIHIGDHWWRDPSSIPYLQSHVWR